MARNFSVRSGEFTKAINVANSVDSEFITLTFSPASELLKIDARSDTSGVYLDCELNVHDFDDDFLQWSFAAKSFVGWLNNVNRGKSVNFEIKDNNLRVYTARASMSLRNRSINNYAARLKFNSESAGVLRSELISSTFKPAASLATANKKYKDSKASSSPLQFIGMVLKGSRLKLLASDGGAALITNVPCVVNKEVRLFPSPHSVGPLARYIAKDFDSVEIHVQSNLIFFKFSDVVFYFVNNDAAESFPVDQMIGFIERERNNELVLSQDNFIGSLSAVQGMAQAENLQYPRVDMSIGLDTDADGDLQKVLNVAAVSKESGNAEQSLAITGNGDIGATVSASVKYLKLAAQVVNQEKIRISWGKLVDWILIDTSLSDEVKLVVAPIIPQN